MIIFWGQFLIGKRVNSLSRIGHLAWPVFIGQIAVLGFTTVDTVLVARYSAVDLAALAVGSAVYISVFVGLMGIVLAVSPVVGQLFGAGRLRDAGDQLHQAVWLALGLMIVGMLMLLFPAPFLAIADTTPEVESKIRSYLQILALSLPAALVFTAFRGFNIAVSRPKAIMALQVGGLALKVPLSALFINGFTIPLTQWHVPELGAVGCSVSTAIVMWSQVIIALIVLRRSGFYAQFGLHEGGLRSPHWPAIKGLLKLGVPMGGSVMIEVTGFTFMAIFIARLGPAVVAGHQLAANLVALMFMIPMALGNAAGTLVAQNLGARQFAEARRLGWHGVEIGLALSCLVGTGVFLAREQILGFYTDDPVIIAAAMPLLLWAWLFHIGDSVQAVAAFVLRAHHITTAPMVIYALAIWGLGIGGGYWLAFGDSTLIPAAMHGASGFWSAATVGLLVSGAGLSLVLAWVHRRETPQSNGLTL